MKSSSSIKAHSQISLSESKRNITLLLHKNTFIEILYLLNGQLQIKRWWEFDDYILKQIVKNSSSSLAPWTNT